MDAIVRGSDGGLRPAALARCAAPGCGLRSSLVTVLEMGLLHWLPVQGDATGWIAALLAAGTPEPHRRSSSSGASAGSCCGAGGRTCRRSSPTTTPARRCSWSSQPRCSSAGCCTAPRSSTHREAFGQQSAAVRRLGARERRRLRARARRVRRQPARRRGPLSHVRADARSQALAVSHRRHEHVTACGQARPQPRAQRDIRAWALGGGHECRYSVHGWHARSSRVIGRQHLARGRSGAVAARRELRLRV